MDPAKKILLVDDHAVVRAGLRAILESSSQHVTVQEASCFEEAMATVRNISCDAVVLDISLPGKSGIETLRQIKRQFPNLPVLILSVHADRSYGVRALKEGAAGCLHKSAAPEKLLEAMSRVLAGKRYISTELGETLANHMAGGSHDEPHETLTAREFEVFRLIAQGSSTAKVADQLSLSPKTVHTHRRAILDKLGLASNADLVSYAYRHRLVD